MDDFISIKGISKKYVNTYIIKDMSMSIPSGRIIGLLGDNGIGKTTFLRLLGNLQQPDEVFPPAKNDRRKFCCLTEYCSV